MSSACLAFLSFIDALVALHKRIPIAPLCKSSSSSRSYYCDVCEFIRAKLSKICEYEKVGIAEAHFFPFMRFLNYEDEGGGLAAHIDLSRTLPKDQVVLRSEKANRQTSVSDVLATSSHTFLFYLTDCRQGGETVLLRSMKTAVLASGQSTYTGPPENVVVSVGPVRGRLFMFPHACPHAGLLVSCTPKLLLRGEVLLQSPVVQSHAEPTPVMKQSVPFAC